MTPKAHRWIGEMEEIAESFQELDLTERIFYGAADVLPLGERNLFGQEIASRAKAFGMRIFGSCRHPQPLPNFDML